MVVIFGRVSQGLTKTYPITVEFPNANGLIKDSLVLLSGARIGVVSDNPKLIGSSFNVQVTINIRDDVKIPRKSTFLVGSSGLLGDRYVDVIPQPEFDPNDNIEPNALIAGTRASGLDDLTVKGGQVMDQLIKELGEIQKLTAQLNEKLLSDQNLQNLSETFANLKKTSVSLSEGTAKLDPILTKADGVMISAQGTMKTAELAAGDVRKAVADVQKVATSASKTIDSAKGLVDSGKSLLDKANKGQGSLGLLLADREAAENLRAFMANLRRSGPIFYKDREPQFSAPAKPGPRR